ncbi:MAG: hypothetical protein Ct9H90mP15_00010 [Candidatus Neomarinimicrobiota bacterium]|nr:MAG: hypothetical protein Ct9H90mP15_00010 [Candidatus Neomarinimicrobiota bacterium]
MTEIQSAIGRLQLQKLDSWIEKRTHLANIFNTAFENVDGLRVTIPPHILSMLIINIMFLLNQINCKWKRSRFHYEYFK